MIPCLNLEPFENYLCLIQICRRLWCRNLFICRTFQLFAFRYVRLKSFWYEFERLVHPRLCFQSTTLYLDLYEYESNSNEGKLLQCIIQHVYFLVRLRPVVFMLKQMGDRIMDPHRCIFHSMLSCVITITMDLWSWRYSAVKW